MKFPTNALIVSTLPSIQNQMTREIESARNADVSCQRSITAIAKAVDTTTLILNQTKRETICAKTVERNSKWR